MRKAVALVLLFLPLATASQEDPEIADPAGDAEVWAFPAPPAPGAGPLADLVDILAAWVGTIDETTLQLHLQTVNFSAAGYSQADVLSDMMMIIDFEIDGRSWDVRCDMIVANDLPSGEWDCKLRPNGSWDDNVPLEGDLDGENAILTYRVPRDAIGAGPGSTLNLTEATVQLHTTSGVDFHDFAQGTPRPFVFPADSQAPPASPPNETAPPDPDGAPANSTTPPTQDTPFLAPAGLMLTLAYVARRRS